MPEATTPGPEGAVRPPRWREVFSGRLGRLTFGFFLLEVLAAVQVLVVTAVMPAVSRELGGIQLYGWAFSASGLATVMAIPLTGQAVDRFGPKRPLALMLSVFAVGTLVAGLAPTMPVFVLGRFLQGAGAGAQYAVGLGTVAKSYPQTYRARVLALLAAAWVLPGLLGPSYGALLASTIGWRWAFLTLLPLLAVASRLVFPSLSALSAETERRRPDLIRPILLAVGAAAIFAGLTDLSVWSAPLVVAGVVVAGPALRRLVVRGSELAGPGLTAALTAGFLLSLAFFAVDGFVPLMLTGVRGRTIGEASVVVTLATVSWSLATVWQSRVASRVSRSLLVAMGGVAIGVGALGVISGLLRTPLVIPYVSWTIAGLGMGVAYPTIYLATMESAGRGAEGSTVALMLLIDSLGVSVGTGLGGSAVALASSSGASLSTGLTATFAIAVAAAAALAVVARRLRGGPVGTRSPKEDRLLRSPGEEKAMGAPVVHFEIISKNQEQLQKFFSELFDWEIDTNNPFGYASVNTKSEQGIPGGIGGLPPDQPDYPGHVTFYVMVDDPQAYLDRAEQLGGKALMPPTEIPGAGVTVAMLADPDGHLIGLTKSS